MRLAEARQWFTKTPWQGLLVGVLAAPLVLAGWAFPPVAVGDIYHYMQRDGTLSFTNVPTDSRFRNIDRHSASLRPRVSLSQLDRSIDRHSRQHRLSPALLLAIIKAESDFDPVAVSKAGAVGLMQLMPQTAVKLNVRDPYDPEENIAGGARHLRYLLDRFDGNLPLALAAYNAGENRVERYRTLPPIHETRRYVRKVMHFYRAFVYSGEPSGFQAARPFTSPTPSRSVAYATVLSP